MRGAGISGHWRPLTLETIMRSLDNRWSFLTALDQLHEPSVWIGDLQYRGLEGNHPRNKTLPEPTTHQSDFYNSNYWLPSSAPRSPLTVFKCGPGYSHNLTCPVIWGLNIFIVDFMFWSWCFWSIHDVLIHKVEKLLMLSLFFTQRLFLIYHFILSFQHGA